MNQKGFATVLGLCLIMAIALCVKGIQEAQMNQSYVTTDFQTEVDLQNAAEGGIYSLAEKIQRELLDKNRNNTFAFSTTQKTSSGNVSVDVKAERAFIFSYKVNYSMPRVNGKYRAEKIHDGKELKDRKVYMLSSSAGIYIERIGKKLYRQAFAYVEFDANGNSDNTIYFTNNLPMYSFYYQKDDPTK